MPLLLAGAHALAAATDAGVPAPLASAAMDRDAAVRRVALGSCFKAQRRGHEIWDAVTAYDPDLFLFAGDTLYPDRDDNEPGLPRLRRAYQALAETPGFARLRQTTPVLAVWDDHDYGRNDAGRDFPFRQESEALFEANWGIAEDDPRRARAGVYFSELLGPETRRLQLIVLDTRYFRSPLTATDRRGAAGRERYVPSRDEGQSMLGEAQWQWLAGELVRDVDLRFIVSSVQVLADGHGWEGWKQLPAERERLFALLREHDTAPVVLLSGDRHVAGFYARDIGLQAPLLEFTSSSLNNTIAFPYRRLALAEAGPQRLGDLYGEANFGTVDIDWMQGDILLAIRDTDGEVVRELRRRFRGEKPADVARAD